VTPATPAATQATSPSSVPAAETNHTSPPSTSSSTSNVQEFLSQVPSEHQIQAVAERLYPLIEKTHGQEVAGKITGMLMDRFPKAEDLAIFIFDDKALQEKVSEANQILKQASSQDQQ